MFSQQMGIEDLPQSCAFFSALDIDQRPPQGSRYGLRDAHHPEKIPHGESLDINQLLAKERGILDPNIVPRDGPIDLISIPIYRAECHSSLTARTCAYIKAQITDDDKELRTIIKEVEKESASSSGSDTSSSQASTGTKSPGIKARVSLEAASEAAIPIPSHAQPQRAC